MRRVLFLALTVSGVVALSGCPAKPKKGECKTSADCASQEGFGKVCVEGRCQECGQDSDCMAGFSCRDNKCVPKPQCASDADCPAGQACEAERCVPRQAGTCGSDRDCGPGQRCEGGRCSAASAAGQVPAECSDPAAFTIRFDFDKSALMGDATAKLQQLADCLKRSPAKKVVIQGNCDERGTAQYNVALGSRRAETARKYLADLGVSAAVETVSFGEEKPLCSEPTEACWATNRRDDFQIER